jgi:quercetin dioxygenase-like cupin family protein
MSFLELDELSPKEPMPGFSGRFIHTDAVTVVHWDIKAGAELPEHSHPHEQLSSLLSGKFEMTVNGETRRMTAGTVAVIGSNIVHLGRAVTDCRFVDVFHPVREDYR